MTDLVDILRIPCRCEEKCEKLIKSCPAYSDCWQEREAANEIERLQLENVQLSEELRNLKALYYPKHK